MTSPSAKICGFSTYFYSSDSYNALSIILRSKIISALIEVIGVFLLRFNYIFDKLFLSSHVCLVKAQERGSYKDECEGAGTPTVLKSYTLIKSLRLFNYPEVKVANLGKDPLKLNSTG